MTALTGTPGLAIIFLLVVLLFLKEIIRTLDRSGSRRWLRTFDIAILPLLLAFSLIILLRLLSL